MRDKHLIIVEYSDSSSMVYEVPEEVEAVEEVTSEVFERWNVKLRNKNGTYSWVRINPPSAGDEIVIRDCEKKLQFHTKRNQVKKDPLTRMWVGGP